MTDGVKVVKKGRLREDHSTCNGCGSLLQSTLRDAKERNISYFYSGDWLAVIQYKITCPVCGCEVDVGHEIQEPEEESPCAGEAKA